MSKVPPPPDIAKILQQLRRAIGGIGSMGAVASFMGISGYALYNSVYFVPGGYRAVKFNAITGLQNRTFSEGAHLAIPFLETPIPFDIRSRPTEVGTSSGSKDLQMIHMSLRVLYRPDAENLHHIYRDLGVNYAETVLPSLINEVMKAVMAQFNASDLLVKRPEVSHRIATQLAHRSKTFHIEISDVSITQMTFGKEYTSAVESKQIAQQMAERAKFQVEQALQEKKSSIVLAEGEAESAKLIGEAIQNNPGFLELRRLDAAKTIAKLVASGRGTSYLDAGALMLNMDDHRAAILQSGTSSKK